MFKFIEEEREKKWYSCILFPIQSWPNGRVWGASLDILVRATFDDSWRLRKPRICRFTEW